MVVATCEDYAFSTPPFKLNRRPQREMVNTYMNGFIDTQFTIGFDEAKLEMRVGLWICSSHTNVSELFMDTQHK